MVEMTECNEELHLNYRKFDNDIIIYNFGTFPRFCSNGTNHLAGFRKRNQEYKIYVIDITGISAGFWVKQMLYKNIDGIIVGNQVKITDVKNIFDVFHLFTGFEKLNIWNQLPVDIREQYHGSTDFITVENQSILENFMGLKSKK